MKNIPRDSVRSLFCFIKLILLEIPNNKIDIILLNIPSPKRKHPIKRGIIEINGINPKAKDEVKDNVTIKAINISASMLLNERKKNIFSGIPS